MWWGELPQALFQGFLKYHRNVCAQVGWLQLSFRKILHNACVEDKSIENTFNCHLQIVWKILRKVSYQNTEK